MAKRDGAALPHSADQVFDAEECDKITWIALHGLPANAVAYGLNISVHKSHISHADHLSNTAKLIEHYIVELVRGHGAGETAEALVARMQAVGSSMGWSPNVLQRAGEYADEVLDDGTDATAMEAIRENAAARHAIKNWRAKHDGTDPDVTAGGRKGKAHKSAVQGVLREDADQDLLQRLGYRGDGGGNDDDEERALMLKWLRKIREIGRLPAYLGEDLG
jgi:hypothetical protein